MRPLGLLAALGLVFPCGAARAAEASAEPAPEAAPERAQASVERPPRALAVAGAVVPGVLIHGTGHFVLGEPETARRLVLIEGIGLAAFLGGGATLFLTGASRYVVGPAAGLTALGFGLFSTSWFADIYGTVSRDGGAARSRLRPPVTFESELGYRYVYDPQFDYRDFVFQRFEQRVGRFRAEPSAWFSLGADNARYRIEGAYRPFGPVPRGPIEDDSWLEVTLGFVHHRYAIEHFTMTTGEVSVDARYDLGRLGRTLAGAFTEFGAGLMVGRIAYDVRGASVPSDGETALLARFGFGVTLRGRTAPGSEVLVYYDHRHDDYAAGLKLTGLGSGVAGHFGAASRLFFDEHWGVSLNAEVGSAYILGGSLVFRQPSQEQP